MAPQYEQMVAAQEQLRTAFAVAQAYDPSLDMLRYEYTSFMREAATGVEHKLDDAPRLATEPSPEARSDAAYMDATEDEYESAVESSDEESLDSESETDSEANWRGSISMTPETTLVDESMDDVLANANRRDSEAEVDRDDLKYNNTPTTLTDRTGIARNNHYQPTGVSRKPSLLLRISLPKQHPLRHHTAFQKRVDSVDDRDTDSSHRISAAIDRCFSTEDNISDRTRSKRHLSPNRKRFLPISTVEQEVSSESTSSKRNIRENSRAKRRHKLESDDQVAASFNPLRGRSMSSLTPDGIRENLWASKRSPTPSPIGSEKNPFVV